MRKIYSNIKIKNGLGLWGILLSVSLIGCATDPYLAEPNLGRTVRDAVALQTLNLDAAKNRTMGAQTDGVIAKSAIERYQLSFETPPPPVNIMNIGLGGAASTGGR